VKLGYALVVFFTQECPVVRLDVPDDGQIPAAYEVERPVDDNEVTLLAEVFSEPTLVLAHACLQFLERRVWCRACDRSRGPRPPAIDPRQSAGESRAPDDEPPNACLAEPKLAAVAHDGSAGMAAGDAVCHRASRSIVLVERRFSAANSIDECDAGLCSERCTRMRD
jgi:hypothetical protein